MSGSFAGRVSRRRLVGGALAAVATGLLAGCPGGGRSDHAAGPWHNGRLYLATGNTTGVFYQIGGGYADIITRHLPGYEATAEPTNAAVENIRRVAAGTADIGFTFADAAADAVTGRAPFTGEPLAVVALARIYSSYTHLIAHAGSGIRDVADLRDRRISTGSPGSGSELVALRLLSASGLDPDRDVRRRPLSLPETAKGMRNGSLDAMFWSGGLPAIGISDLMADRGEAFFVPTVELLSDLRKKYGEAYTSATIPAAAYKQPADVPTVAVASLVVVARHMPERLAYQLTRLLFDYQAELAKAHPEGRNFTRATAALTSPVPLHPGARRYYYGST